MERSLLQWRLLPLLALIASFLSVFFASRSYEVCFVLCFCHVIAVQNGGFVSFSFLSLMFLLIPMFVCLFLQKETQCSLLPHDHYWISSKRILTPDGLISGSGES